MEQLVVPEKRRCMKCGSLFLFRQCKYGCEFGCECSRASFDHVLNDYVAELHSERQQTFGLMGDYVPCVRGTKTDGTEHERIASVEIDFSRQRALVRFIHFDEALLHLVNGSLSSAILSALTPLESNALAIPLELVDLALFELRSLAQGRFFVNAPSTEVLEIARTNASPSQNVTAEMPTTLQQYLLQHQVDGVRRILDLGGRALLCDEMGVGKTLTALGVISTLKVFPVLVVCPSSVKHIWAEEIEKFLVPQQISLDDMHVIRSSNDALVKGGVVPKIVVISYHMAVRLSAMVRETRWKCVVCDESHLLHTNTSGSDALYTTLMGEVAKQSPYCLLLSGTPLTTGAFDLFNQIDALHPGLLGHTRWDFALRYCSIAANPFLKIGPCVRKDEFSSLVEEKIMVRRRKKQVLDLPSKQRILYPVEEEEGERGEDAVCEDETVSNFQRRYKSNWVLKRNGIRRALDYLRATNEQIVLFAHHVELLHFLETELKKRKESFLLIKGGVDMDVRQHLIRNFAEKKTKFAIVGITACSVGISLASSSCAVFCELPPNATLLKQAEDRLHRPGQVTKTTFYYLVGQNSRFDKMLFERLKEDDSEVRQLIDGDASPLSFCFTNRSLLSPPNKGVVEPAAKHTGKEDDEVPCSHKLLFSISRYTGRIHVRGESNTFYSTLTVDEARRCVRERSSSLWQQLGDFMSSYDALTSYGQRQLRGSWHSADIHLTTNNHPTGKRNRYTLNFRCGWGFWSKVKQPNFSFVLFCPLLKQGQHFTPICLDCGTMLPSQSKAVHPGDVHEILSDITLFCSGNCRQDFYFKRSSKFMRRIIVAEDKGVCAVCGVQCEVLVSRLQQSSSAGEREELLKSMHPQLLQYPKLYRNLVENPTAGVCWNADHIIPVSSGGGEATKDNIQTLCVVCHGIKTAEERKTTKRDRVAGEKRVVSTVDRSLEMCCLNNHDTRLARIRLMQKKYI